MGLVGEGYSTHVVTTRYMTHKMSPKADSMMAGLRDLYL